MTSDRRKILHLPDCSRVPGFGVIECDCGRPKHPLPATMELKRISRGKMKGRLKAVRKGAKI